MASWHLQWRLPNISIVLTEKNGDSCGVCTSCRKYSKLVHPDLYFTFPVIRTNVIDKPTSIDYISKWRQYFLENPYPKYEKWIQLIADENKQGVIFVEEARDLIHKLNQKSYEAEYKVSIIWLPETMHSHCANKILKILEEPPFRTIFILVSEAEEKLLSTIRSRCQVIRMPKISDKDLESRITSLSHDDNINPATIARLARGNYPAALEMIRNDEERVFNLGQFALMMRNGYGRKLAEILTWSEEMGSIGRIRQLSFLNYCGQFLRENFFRNLQKPELVYMDDQENDFSRKFSPFINEKNVILLYQEFDKTYRDISMNGNAKLVFLDLGLNVSKMIRM